MIRVTNKRYHSGNYVIADLIADTKSEVDNSESITGLPVGVDIDMGSTIITTDGHFALRNSSGEWVWQNEKDDDNISPSVSNSTPKAISRKAIDIEESESDNSYDYDAIPIEELSEKKDEK